jgi:uncharacterized iron-regulated membrane protein
MTSVLIINAILCATIFTLILGLIAWAIRTAHRDEPGLGLVPVAPRERRSRASARTQLSRHRGEPGGLRRR